MAAAGHRGKARYRAWRTGFWNDKPRSIHFEVRAEGSYQRIDCRNCGRRIIGRGRIYFERSMQGPSASAFGMLGDVREFVGDQVPAAFRMRRIFTAAENNVASERVGPCVYRAGGFGGRITGVYAETAEVVTDTRFEKVSGLVIERLTIGRRHGVERRGARCGGG
jgi:hypothetical protein